MTESIFEVLAQALKPEPLDENNYLDEKNKDND